MKLIICVRIFVSYCLLLPFQGDSLALNKRHQFYSYENSLIKRGFENVIGTDEVGRGAIAGPVLAVSCCVYKHDALIEGVTDSKILSSDERRTIYERVLEETEVYKWRASQRSSQDIDSTNILKATMECFRDSIEDLVVSENFPLDKTYAIVDGKSTPKLIGTNAPISCRPMVSADALIYTVSISSIIAKELRDALMVEMHCLYPQYGFAENKGYQTRAHIEAIGKYGPSPIHRMSFKALKHR